MIYGLLIFFAIIYLMPLFVMLVTSFKTMDEDPERQHAGLAAVSHLRALGARLGRDLRRPDLRRDQGLFLEFHQDGGSGRR